jgi:hypothetical protein
MNVESARMRQIGLVYYGVCEIIQLHFILSFTFIIVTYRTSINILHDLYNITYSVLCSCTLLFELVFYITFCVALCVDCCVTLGIATNLVY